MNASRKAELEATVAKLTERAAQLKELMAETNQELWFAQGQLQEASLTDEEVEDMLNDFNYVGSRHHY